MHIFKFTFLFFIASLFFASCKLDKPILPGDPGYVKSTPPGDTTSKGNGAGTGGTSTTTSSTYYVKGTLNGKNFDWEVDEATWGTGNAINSSTDQGVKTAELQGEISSYTSSQSIPAISIGFRTYQVDLNKQDEPSIIAYFNNFISAGSWNLATDNTLTPGSKKIVIYYSNASGNYSSEGVQTGNSANITSVKQVPASLGVRESLDIKLTFSCKLYNLDGSGSSLTLTNAQASINIPDQLY